MSERLPDLKTASRERIGWIDLLRVLACFLVVFSHCCDPFVAVFDSDRPTFLYGCFSGSLVRCCVPLFVMMTGVLLLPVRTDTAVFYRKRIGRILLALIFWSVALPLLTSFTPGSLRRRRSTPGTTPGRPRFPNFGTSYSTSPTKPRRCGISTCSQGFTSSCPS